MIRATGSHPQFDIDLKYGDYGEQTVAALLTGDVTVEVKTKSYRDDLFYIETDHDPGRTGVYQKSGLRVTTARWWAFNVDNVRVELFLTSAILNALIHRSEAEPGEVEPKECTRGSCPTKGYLVAGSWLRHWAHRARGS